MKANQLEKLFCLMVETLVGVLRGISTEAVDLGGDKWDGIAAMGYVLFAAPDTAHFLLILDKFIDI